MNPGTVGIFSFHSGGKLYIDNMKSWKSILIIILAWVLVGLISSWRTFSLAGEPGGMQGFLRQTIVGLPGWIIWAAATPFIYWLSGRLPVKGKQAPVSMMIQVVSAVIYAFIYIAVFLLLENFLGVGLRISSQFISRYLQYATDHFFTLAMLFLALSVIFYFLRNYEEKQGRLAGNFLNSILVKTRYGYVLVEIERFQYVRDSAKKVLFHTGRRKHLTRDMVEIDPESIVEERRYDPQRQIVIDLGKIRRANKVGGGDYHFYIGYSHQLILNPQLYHLLKAWLPRPVPSRKAEYF